MTSSENSVRRLAEKIYGLSREPISGTPEEMEREEISQIEYLLSEAMDRSYAKAQVEWAMRPSTDSAKEARSAAYREAAEIAEETGKNGMPYYGDMHIQIADKLRRKSEGV